MNSPEVINSLMNGIIIVNSAHGCWSNQPEERIVDLEFEHRYMSDKNCENALTGSHGQAYQLIANKDCTCGETTY